MDCIGDASWKAFCVLLSSAFQTAVCRRAYSVNSTCLRTASMSLVVASVLLVFPWLLGFATTGVQLGGVSYTCGRPGRAAVG